MSDKLSFNPFKPDRQEQPNFKGLEPIAPTPEFYRANAGDPAAFSRAILYGIGGAIVGSIVYAAFTIVTHIEIGYVALGVGYLVGKAMMAGSGNRGGRNYQIAAAVLTYMSVSLAAVPEELWTLHKQGTEASQISAHGWTMLAGYGVASPFLDLAGNTFSGLIGLFILFIGIRAAWRLTSASSNTASHPFTA